MNRKIWLVIFLLGSLILLLGGVHRPEHSAENNNDDPAVRSARTIVAQAAGPAESWRNAARKNPLWILQIEAAEE